MTAIRTIMEKLKMIDPEKIDPETVESLVCDVVNSLPANCLLAELQNEFGLDLAKALRQALSGISQQAYEEWVMCRPTPSELRYSDNGDPMIMRPPIRRSVPRTVPELVDVAKRYGRSARRHVGNPQNIDRPPAEFFDEAKRRARILPAHHRVWFIRQLANICNGADELGEAPAPPKRVTGEDLGRTIDAGIAANRELRRNAKIQCPSCGYGDATLGGGCPNCGGSVTRPTVVVVPARV
jgi:hypothetical protein